METCNTSHLYGKKVRNVYIVHETMFSDQTGQFPTLSLLGSKYIMVMVEIDSDTILLKRMKNRNDTCGPFNGTAGWRVASRTLGEGFKTLRCRIASRIHGWGLRPHMSNQSPLWCRYRLWCKNHLTLTGQSAWNQASSPQLVSHQQSLFTLPITSRK